MKYVTAKKQQKTEQNKAKQKQTMQITITHLLRANGSGLSVLNGRINQL